MTEVTLIIISCLCIISLIVVSLLSIFLIIYEKNQAESSNDNEGKIDKRYIEDKYGKTIDLMRGMSQTKNIKMGIIFINKDDATDIKLPYECLSPIKTFKSEDDIFVLDIDRNQYYQYIISDAYGKLSVYTMPNLINLSRSKEYERYSKSIDDYNYHFLTVGSNITRNYEVNQDLLDLDAPKLNSCVGLKKLINKHTLNSDSFVAFYVSLMKMKQLTYDEMCDTLIRFEKSLEQMERVNLVNNNAKINELFDIYNIYDSYQNNNITKIDEDLASLIKNKDILN